MAQETLVAHLRKQQLIGACGRLYGLVIYWRKLHLTKPPHAIRGRSLEVLDNISTYVHGVLRAGECPSDFMLARARSYLRVISKLHSLASCITKRTKVNVFACPLKRVVESGKHGNGPAFDGD